MRADVRPRLAAERRRDGEQPRPGKADDREHERCEAAVDVERELARVPSGENRREAGSRDLVGDVAARMCRTDDEHGAVAELLRAAVVGRVELVDRGVELVCEVRDHRVLVLEDARRDDDVVRLVTPVARREDVPVVLTVERVHADTGRHGEREALGIRLEVLGHLEARRVGVSRRGEAHAREPVDERGRVQPQRRPALPPGVADPVVRVDDHERPVVPCEVVPHRQPGLAPTDDDRLDAFRSLRCHDSSSRRPLRPP